MINYYGVNSNASPIEIRETYRIRSFGAEKFSPYQHKLIIILYSHITGSYIAIVLTGYHIFTEVLKNAQYAFKFMVTQTYSRGTNNRMLLNRTAHKAAPY